MIKDPAWLKKKLGAIELVLKRDDLPSTKTKEPQPNTTAAQRRR